VKRRDFVRFPGGVAASAAVSPFVATAEHSRALPVSVHLHAGAPGQDWTLPKLAAEWIHKLVVMIVSPGSTEVSVVAKNATTIFPMANPASKLAQPAGVFTC
jgi:hypothetical protein